ncbi:hypothetical protein [Okeania sp. SIO2C9]|nr:hypothetical protein [Okeania sp. SIO2C9]
MFVTNSRSKEEGRRKKEEGRRRKYLKKGKNDRDNYSLMKNSYYF